ncbi:MAG: hypothetical protein HY721_04710 [Planctomycetes bacterium]|nr:hypothetical protein [Planctomycetota bacterium]
MKVKQKEATMRRRIAALAAGVWAAAALEGTVGTGGTAARAPAAQESLADDPSPGHLADREGAVFVRPILSPRWAPAGEGDPIEAGAWLKTAARGANAAEVRLADGTRLVLGPAGLLELTAPGSLRLDEGELSVEPAPGSKVAVAGPGGAREEVAAARVLRARDGRLAPIDEPAWLKGYREKSSTEAMGSLLATVDGRDVPLSLGYHKVTVDIRDQISRTQVEESFQNHTDSVLEGVFYFPLPQDASISGFAMWIGDELVEADVVEKERARAIYETILAERRDPGLLEWTGGNVFKARVYPIPAGGEKRIRITYTQVLPKEGSAYRYTYALQSEMLRLKPLRELRIEVKIASEEPIASVRCPSHPARVRATEHAAQVEVEAQEYRPSRDLEVLVETRPQAKAVLVSHRRADEGYFMALVSADALMGRERGAAGRDPGAARPLDLVIVADTSASMSDVQLREQRAFVASLLESLGDRDRFQLLAFDVETAWLSDEPLPGGSGNAARALAFLEARGALGWTDLERAFREALSRASRDSHVVYVGDGIPGKGDADPAALAQALKGLHAGRGTCHAVAPGSTFESLVLKSIASLGGGSLHRVGGGKDAGEAAGDLLREMTSSALVDLRLEWRGVRVARVYPEELPNLPAGGQQVVLGRYLPEPGETRGTLVVRASLGVLPIAAEVPAAFAGEGEGNSFVPRLWARLHLDHLLEQAQTPEVKDRVIALSEELQIITPYTSLLVLESDADRERFQVRKGFRMRGGEEFFAEGRAGAQLDLAREQSQLARRWRQDLRRRVLERYARLGIEPEREVVPAFFYKARGAGAQRWAATALEREGTKLRVALDDLTPGTAAPATVAPGDLNSDALAFDEVATAGAEEAEADQDEKPPDGAEEYFGKEDAAAQPFAEMAKAAEAPAQLRLRNALADTRALRQERLGRRLDARLAFGDVPELGALFYGAGLRPRPSPPFGGLFLEPGSPTPPREPAWPAEVREVTGLLDRRAVIAGLAGGLKVTVEAESTGRRGRARPASAAEHLLSREAWAAAVQSSPESAPRLEWTRAGRRGALDPARGLGSSRAGAEADRTDFPAPYDLHFADLEAGYGHYVPSVTRGGARAVLRLVAKDDPGSTAEVVVDLERRAVLEVSALQDGKLRSRTTFLDHVQVLGAWWPSRLETRDGEGKLLRAVKLAHEALAPEAFAAALDRALAPAAEATMLELPLPGLVDARQRALDGKAALADRWVLLNHFAATQRWDRAAEELRSFEALAAQRRGLAWVRLSFLQASRRLEEAKAVVLDLSSGVAAGSRPGDLALALALLGAASGSLGPSERQDLLAALEPVFERQPPGLEAPKRFERERLDVLRGLGRHEDARRLLEELALRSADDLELQIEWARDLEGRGETDRAVAHLDGALARSGPWTPEEEARLRSTAAFLLYDRRRLPEYLDRAGRWLDEGPSHVGDDVASRLLSAHVLLDREADADRLIEAWLSRGPEPGLGARWNRTSADGARFQAALHHALGSGHELHARRIDPRWRPRLAELVLACARDPALGWIPGSIVGDHRFHRTDEGREAMARLHGILAAEADSLAPQAVVSILEWTAGRAPREGEPSREDIARKLLARWEREVDPGSRALLGQAIAGSGGPKLLLALRRLELEHATGPEEKARAAWNLFHLLGSRPWSAEAEAEVLGLFDRLGSPQLQAAAAPVLAVYASESRGAREVEAIPDRSKLPRRQLRPLEAAARRRAREAAVETLRKLEASGLALAVVPFVKVERLTLEARRPKEPARVSKDLRELFEGVPMRNVEDPLDGARDALARRALVTAAYVATLPGSEASLAGALLELLVGLIARREAEEEARIDAREEKRDLLVALDRPADLEAALEAWAAEAGDAAGDRFRVARGHVLAELGSLADAVRAFEAVAARDALGAADWRALAGWHLALGDKAKHRDARVRAHEAEGEWQVHNALQRDLHRYQRRGDAVPEELDEDVFLRLAALFRKATSPGHHLWILRAYYEATKDFRLLESTADAVVGQTTEKVYGCLQGLGQVLELVGDEATCDRLVRRLGELVPTATPADRRALRLLDLLVERRAADQQNGGGPHAQAALEAMRSAFQEAWREGELALMAGFLAQLGKVVEPLRSEQIRELRLLHDLAAAGSEERFAVARHRAAALHAGGQREDAVQVLGGALGEHAQARGGLLPPTASGALETYVGYLTEGGELRAAERILRRELTLGHNLDLKRWLELELFELMVQAVERGQALSSGRGADLYAAARREMLEALERSGGEGHAQSVSSHIRGLFRAAHAKKVAGAGDDLRVFAFQDVPRVLRTYAYRNGQGLVSNVAHAVRDVLGRREAVAFLVARAEGEPRWLERQGQDFWPQHAYRLGEWALEVKGRLGELEPRVLAIALAALREDLLEGEARTRVLYDKRHGRFWPEKAEDFRRAALEALEARRQSEAGSMHIAEYLFRGLERRSDSIDALARFYRARGLGDGGQWQLAGYLAEAGRHAEAVPLLEGLIARHPESLEHRAALCRAYHKLAQREKLAAALDAADEHFRAEGLWHEGHAAGLGNLCLEVAHPDRAVEYLREAARMHEKSAPNRGVGDGVLSSYYVSLAQALSGLGRTKEAVDAAAGAVVSWGRRADGRAQALESLLQVLRAAKDLGAYEASFEAEVAAARLENPTIRKALGRVHLERKSFARAARHLEAAVEHGPADPEAERKLIEAFDGLGDPARASARVLALAGKKERDFGLFKELGDRLAAQGKATDAERAYCALAELSANESEGRALLAELREGQARFGEAAAEWRQVVRVRSREPGGYVGLGRALLGAGRPAEAREALERVLRESWHPRFGDVHAEARKLVQRLQR